MRPTISSFLACLLCCCSLTARCQDIDNLADLVSALKSSKDARIGVLSESNFNSVKRILPPNVRPQVFDHEEDLVKRVLSGDLVAGLTSGLPEASLHQSFHIFPSGVLGLHSVLMAPDYSTDYLNGVKDPALSSKQLALAINAAISQIQYEGLDQELAKKNGAKEIAQAFTCKSDNRSHFNLPNRDKAAGLLAMVLKNGVLRVLCQGKPNWGDDDGNYQVVPPKGFFPDYLDKIVDIFQKLSGPDNKPYGKIKIERVFTENVTTPFPWYMLFDGTAHMTEPYFLLDATYSGSGKSCLSDSDCLASGDEVNKTETCNLSKNGFCEHPVRPRILMLRSTCTTVGIESMFYTKKAAGSSPPPASGVSTGAVVYIIVVTLVLALSLLVLGFVIFRERYGTPLFRSRY